MVDTTDPVALAAAGLDLSRTRTPNDVPDASFADRVNTLQAAEQAQLAERLNRPRGALFRDALGETLASDIYHGILAPTYQADESFTRAQFLEKFKAAQETLPEEWWGKLHGAVSAEHFDAILRRSQAHIDAQQRIAEAGWDGTAANFLATAIDPTSWASYGISIKALRALQLSNKAWVAGHAASGAWANTVTTAMADALGNAKSPTDYMFAGGMGLALGGTVGAFSRNAGHEASVMAKIGNDLAKAAVAGAEKVKAPSAKAATMFGIRRAADEVPVVHKETTNAPADPSIAPEVANRAAFGNRPAGERDLFGNPVEAPKAPVAEVPAPTKVNPDQGTFDFNTVTKAAEHVVEHPADAPRFFVDQHNGTHVIIDSNAPAGSPVIRGSFDNITQAEAQAARLNKIEAAPTSEAKVVSPERQNLKDMAQLLYERRQAAARKAEGVQRPTLVPAGGKASKADAPGFYKFGDNVIRRSDDGEEPGRMLLTSHTKGGKQTGFVELKQNPDGRWEIDMIETFPQYRGKGVAKALNLAAVRETGQPYTPSGRLTDMGHARAKEITPWVGPLYRKPEGSKLWLSPKQLVIEREMLAQDIARSPNASKSVKDRMSAQLADYDKAIKSLPKDALDPANWQRMGMFSKRDPMAHVGPMRAEVEGAIRELLDRILPRWAKMDVRIEDALRNHDGAALDGYYVRRVIWLARNANNMAATAFHEGVHALKHLGLFSNEDWAKLVSKANSRPLKALRDHVKELYKNENLTPELLDEEVVAHMLGGRAVGKTFGKVDAILERVTNFLREVRDALNIRGFRTNQDIFHDINSGAIANRFQDATESTQAFHPGMAAKAANAAPNPVIHQDFLEDANYKSVSESDVPYAAGKFRFDRAWIYGKSKNAITRLLGGHLLNEAVGKRDHSINHFSADLDQLRIQDNYMGEFNRYRQPALQEWADSLKLGPAEALVRQNEFYEQVGRYVAQRGSRREGPVHPAVKKFGDAVRAQLNDIREDFNNPMRREGLQGRPLTREGDLAENERYLWRKFNHDHVRSATEVFGQNGVVRMVRGAIRSAQPDIEDSLLDRLAEGYVRGIHRRAVGLGDEWSIALGEGDRAKLAALLRQDVHQISDQEIDHVLQRVMPEKTGQGSTANLKGRILLDESYIERNLPTGSYGHADGQVGDLAFADLLEHDIAKLMERYTRRASGRLALARMRVELPGTATDPSPRVIVNGLTNDTEIASMVQRMHEYGADLMRRDPSYTQEMLDHEVNTLKFDLDRIIGNPNPQQMTNSAWWFRMIRGYMTMRLLNQVGIAQVGETGTLVGTMGMKAAATQMPALKRIITSDGESVLKKEHYRWLESIGIGVERMHGLHFHNLDEIGEQPFSASRGTWKDRVTNWVRLGERATYEASGMSFIQQQQERAAAAMIAQDWANMAMKMKAGGRPDKGWLRRAAQIGVSEPMMQRIFRQMHDHASFKDGMLFKDRIESLNAQNWTDLEAKAALENTIYRYTRKLIQKGDLGSMAQFMHDPIWQTMFQFRSFPFQAWTNQFQYGLHMLDHRTFNSFTWSTVWNGLVRYAQVQALAAGRSDRDKYLEKNATWTELGKSGFSRAGWSSILPMAIDTALLFGGNTQGIFNARSTGQASNILLGSPVASAFDSAAKGIGGLANSAWTQRAPSQAEMRQTFSLLPFQNLMPIAQAYDLMIGKLPEKRSSHH